MERIMHIYNKRMVNLLKQVPLLHHMHGSLALDAAGLVDVLERIENAGVFMLDDAHAAVGPLADNVQKGKVEEVDVALSKVCGLDADGGTTAEVGGEAFEHDVGGKGQRGRKRCQQALRMERVVKTANIRGFVEKKPLAEFKN